MAQQVFYMKQGDLRTPITVILKDANNAVVDLTAAVTVKFFMRKKSDSTSKIKDKTCTIASPATQGKVSYQWTGTDTDTPGKYAVEFLVDFGDSKPQRFPTRTDDEILVEIADNYAE